VNHCGICGSDLRMFYEGPSPRYTLPIVLGHEFVGTVEEVGPRALDFRPGDVASVAPVIPCMNCRPCGQGQDNLCERGQVIGTHIAGAMANFFYVPEQMVSVGGLVKIPEGVDPQAAALTEIFACCLHGLRLTEFEPGDEVLIIGEGPVGLAHLQLVRLMAAGRVVITGSRSSRLRLAGEFGADVVLDINKRDLRQFADETHYQPDVAIIATASMAATELALDLLRPGGSLLMFSGYPHGTSMTSDAYRLHYGEKHIHGSIDCTIRDFHKAAELLPQLKILPMITSTFPLAETPQAFRAARHDGAVKTMIAP
jgi:L-iditol 2-dehydrogenase